MCSCGALGAGDALCPLDALDAVDHRHPVFVGDPALGEAQPPPLGQDVPLGIQHQVSAGGGGHPMGTVLCHFHLAVAVEAQRPDIFRQRGIVQRHSQGGADLPGPGFGHQGLQQGVEPLGHHFFHQPVEHLLVFLGLAGEPVGGRGHILARIVLLQDLQFFQHTLAPFISHSLPW